MLALPCQLIFILILNSVVGFQSTSKSRVVTYKLPQHVEPYWKLSDVSVSLVTFGRRYHPDLHPTFSLASVFINDDIMLPVTAPHSMLTMQSTIEHQTLEGNIVAYSDQQKLAQVTFFKNFLPAATGIFVACSLLFSIAMTGETFTFTSWTDINESFVTAYRNMYDSIAPLGLSDIISIIVGESTAALIAALASGLIIISFKLQKILPDLITKPGTDVVADGDFLLTKAATVSLLMSIGIPQGTAKVLSVILGSLRYGVVKFGAKRREQIVEEDRILDELLAEQQKKDELEQIQGGIVMSSIVSITDTNMSEGTVASTNLLLPVQDKNAPNVDFVEIFSDIAKWLQFDVLCSNLGGTIMWNGQPLFSGVEAALFGAISCLLAQSYCDVLHTYFNLGGSSASERVLSRTSADWISLYFSQTIYGAALFVTYEAFQIPAKWLLNAFLSGGVDGCIGAIDYGGCLETFVELNPVEETPEAVIYSRFFDFVDTMTLKVATLSEMLNNNLVSNSVH